MAEADEQAVLIEWFRRQYPAYQRASRLSLNGVSFGSGKAAGIRKGMAKKQGLVIGESDLLFTIPRGGYHGIAIEMKTKTGKMSAEQEEYLEFMREMGYAAFCCRGADEAITVLKGYMDG